MKLKGRHISYVLVVYWIRKKANSKFKKNLLICGYWFEYKFKKLTKKIIKFKNFSNLYSNPYAKIENSNPNPGFFG